MKISESMPVGLANAISKRNTAFMADAENTIKIPQMETITKTAEILNLPVHFVRSAVANGDVVFVRAGRKFLVNIDSVIAFLSTGIPQGAAHREAALKPENAPRISPISLK